MLHEIFIGHKKQQQFYVIIKEFLIYSLQNTEVTSQIFYL